MKPNCSSALNARSLTLTPSSARRSKLFEGTIVSSSRYWDVVSADAKDFIRKLLNNNPGVRLTAEQAILHPWLVKGDHELITVHLEKTMRQLRNFNGKRKFKAAARMVLTTRKFSSVHCPAARPPS